MIKIPLSETGMSWGESEVNWSENTSVVSETRTCLSETKAFVSERVIKYKNTYRKNVKSSLEVTTSKELHYYLLIHSTCSAFSS